MLPCHHVMGTQSLHVVPTARSNPLMYMLNLLCNVEPALHTPHLRPDGIQDELCDPPTHPISYANRQTRLDEQAGFMPVSQEEMEDLQKRPLSKDNVEKLDSVLAQLSLTVDKVRRMQVAIGTSQLSVPEFSNRLNRMKWLIEGDIARLSDYKAKGVGTSTWLLCDVALTLLKDMNGAVLFITQECDSLVVDSDGAVTTAGFSPEAIRTMIKNKFVT